MLKKIYKEIKKFDKIFIFGHVRPDGDCYGSQFGLKALIEDNFPEKEVHVVGDISEFVSFLGTPEKAQIKDEDIEGNLAIVVDCGAPDRVSDQRYKLGKKIIKIDHHIATGEYGDLVYVEEEKPACCQILVEFALINKMKITERAAFPLYFGLVTDTGRFRFRGVDAHTFKAAGVLVDAGVDIEKIDNLLSVEDLNVIHFKGYIYESAIFSPNGVVYAKITEDVVKQYGLSFEDAAAQISLLGTIRDYPLYFLFIEYPTGIRIRLRSRGPRVDKLANMYGGGGHEKAAGGNLDLWNDLDEFINKADALIKYYKETGKDDLY